MILLHNQYSSNREIQQQHSLVESKKQQWAKEKAEMALLGKSYSRSNQYEKTSVRSHYYSSIDLSEHGDEKTYQNLISKDYKPNFENNNNTSVSQTSPNLPPIVHNKYRLLKNNSEEETSGYMSESHPSSGSSGEWRSRDQQHQQYFHQNNGAGRKVYHHANDIDSVKLQNLSLNSQNVEHPNAEIYYHNDINNESGRSSSKYQQPGRYYYQSQGHHNHNHRHPGYNVSANSLDTPMPTTPSSVASQTTSTASQYNNHDTASYGGKSKEERAKWNYLYDPNNKDSRRSSQSGPIWLEKGLIELQKSETATSFLRGQNIPMDPAILAERETKRRKAMELQIAIKQQLEERETMKKWEKERMLREERLEEERLRRQLDNERKRMDHERKLQEEKDENKRKKEELMRQALEKAAQDAKLEKERRRHGKGMASRSVETLSADYSTDFEKERNEDDAPNTLVDSKSENVEESKDGEEEDDGEQILIGTPIKLRKKDVDKFRRRPKATRDVDSEESDHEPAVREFPKSRETHRKPPPPQRDATPPPPPPHQMPPKHELNDLNGLALLFQNISPIVPLQFQSNLCLISPLANIANYPLALMLAQQQQKVDLSANRNIYTPMSSEPESEKNGKQDVQQGFESSRSTKSTPVLPHHGTFTKDTCTSLPRFDAATSTEDDEQHKLSLDFRYNVTQLETPERDVSWTSVSTQTEETQNCEFCRASNYHRMHGHNKHHDLFLKETVTSVVQTKKSKGKDEDPDEAASAKESPDRGDNQEMMTTTTTTTTTMIRSKSRDRNRSKLDDRPKWGVNRPLMQYLKASERDCFSLRNRRKRYMKKTDETKSCEAFSTVDGTVEENSSRRNVCTEILPIKTDGQGNVYIVRRNSFVLNESSFLNRKPNGSNVCKKLLLRSSSQQSKVTKVKDDFDPMVDENN